MNKPVSPLKIQLIAEKSAFEERLGRALGDDFELKRVTLKTWLSGAFSNMSCGLQIICSPIPVTLSEALLDEIEVRSQAAPVLLLVDKKDIPFGVQALARGAFQYVKMPLADEELKLLVTTAVDQPGAEETKEAVEGLDQLIGQAAVMRSLYDLVHNAAESDIPVLILGETGTGKDLVAQAIHNMSSRSAENYIPVNLGAIPRDLIGNELFGHEKGAFTGAQKKHSGVFEQAAGGTVFLDEIDTVDEKVQISLLRLLEQKRFKRLGGKRFIKSHARVIAATNNDLVELVKSGNFRQDLFFRLDVFRITVPPLRERREDIPMLSRHFLALFRRTMKRKVNQIGNACMQALQNYDWPGNVRELKNVIQRATLVCEDEALGPEHLPPRFQKHHKPADTITIKIGTPLADVEKTMVEQALRLSANNRTEAARLLGISRRAIYNKLKKYGLL